MIVGITPVRISFAGGGTDMPEYYKEFGGNIISSTISQFTYAIIQFRNDNSFQARDLKHYTVGQQNFIYKQFKELIKGEKNG